MKKNTSTLNLFRCWLLFSWQVYSLLNPLFTTTKFLTVFPCPDKALHRISTFFHSFIASFSKSLYKVLCFALGEGMDWMRRTSCSVSATPVIRIFPFVAFLFNPWPFVTVSFPFSVFLLSFSNKLKNQYFLWRLR